MATSGKLAEAVSHLTDVPLGTVKFYQAGLRHAGLLTVGGRGRSAREVTVEDAVSLLLAVIVAPSADGVAEALKLTHLSRGLDPFIAEGRYRLTTQPEARDRLKMFVEAGEGFDSDNHPVRNLKLEIFEEFDRTGWMSASTKSVFAFLCDVVRGCQHHGVLAEEYGGGGSYLRPDTFLDYDTKAMNFVLDIWIDSGEHIEDRPPGGHSFSLGVEFCVVDGWRVSSNYREVKRLNLNACNYLARVLSDSAVSGAIHD